MTVETLDSETANGTGPTDLIRKTLEPLIEFRRGLEEKRREVRAELTGLEEEIRQVERHLKLAGIIPKQHTGKRVKVRSGLSESMLARAEEAIPEEEFTIRMFAEAMGGVAEGTAQKAIDILYAQGRIRKTGLKVPVGSNSYAKALHFKRVDG